MKGMLNQRVPESEGGYYEKKSTRIYNYIKKITRYKIPLVAYGVYERHIKNVCAFKFMITLHITMGCVLRRVSVISFAAV